MSDPLQIKSRFQILQESFDKKYLEEIFQEGEKLLPEQFPRGKRQNMLYDYNGYRYIIQRIPLELLAQRQLDRLMRGDFRQIWGGEM
ncbi:MAG: hypothetical protein ACFFDF_14195 [Candidatus Odinarchaeota archaeon]